MIVSTEALGLEEDLSGVEASVADLITAKEAGDMVGSCRAWDFGPSLMTKDMIEELRQLGCFGYAKVGPSEGETIPKSKADDAVVFRDFFPYVAFASRWHASFVKSWKHSRYNCIILPLMVLLL